MINALVSTEGRAGHSQSGGQVLTFGSDMCLAELVDDNNPVPAGVPSAKVLVTNLHNRTQPLVRYELTDRFTREQGTPAAARPQRRRAALSRRQRPGTAAGHDRGSQGDTAPN